VAQFLATVLLSELCSFGGRCHGNGKQFMALALLGSVSSVPAELTWEYITATARVSEYIDIRLVLKISNLQ